MGKRKRRWIGPLAEALYLALLGGWLGAMSAGLPSLLAAKAAGRHGEEAFLRFHFALFRAFFEEGRDIGDERVLVEVAREAGLDLDGFTYFQALSWHLDASPASEAVSSCERKSQAR